MVQWVKDLALLQLWCSLQLRLRFSRWPWNFRMLQGGQKRKKKKKKKDVHGLDKGYSGEGEKNKCLGEPFYKQNKQG